MKTKLLKKVRKRYKIIYYEKQVTLYDHTFNGECMILIDDDCEWKQIIGVEICNSENYQKWFEYRQTTKEDAKDLLLKKLSEWIKHDYRKTRKRKVKQTIKTIWYDKNNI